MSDRDDWEDSLIDLISRMDTAECRLMDMAMTHKPNSTEAIRLESKANGVRLASGYVSEEFRRIRRTEQSGQSAPR
jgi:hypothetical protein